MSATLFFAKKGYASVSMRDIANAIGIKPASLYNHFASKDALWREALDHTKELYFLYFRQLEDAVGKAGSFGEVLDIMFYEPVRLTNVFTCYAFCMIQAEQFRDEYAAEIFTEVFQRYSIDFVKKCFNECIEKGQVRKFDTEIVATLLMNTVLIGLEVKIQEWLGRPVPYDPSKMFDDLRRFILDATGASESPAT